MTRKQLMTFREFRGGRRAADRTGRVVRIIGRSMRKDARESRIVCDATPTVDAPLHARVVWMCCLADGTQPKLAFTRREAERTLRDMGARALEWIYEGTIKEQASE